jgi:hypothetical protein
VSDDTPSIALVVDGRQWRGRFGRYSGEILRAEGLSDYQEVELSEVTGALLARFGLVLLAGCGAVAGLAELLATYVQAGGRLILIRPPAELAPLAGLCPRWQATPGAALLVEAGPPGFGTFPYEPVQVAGPVDLFDVRPGTTVLARTVSGRWPVSSVPAIVERSLGQGRVLAFLYDLPHSVARLRQGDPDLAGHDTDGLDGVRPNDAQQWQIDAAGGHLPQAELHQTLLARAVEWLCPWPLPRLWHLPGDAQALLVLTGDLCSDRPDSDLVAEASMAEAGGGRLTYYLHQKASLEPQTAAALRRRGHSLSIHPFAEPFSAPEMDATLARHLAAFETRFGGRPRTVRHHRLQWLGWAEQAGIEQRHGLRMDLNFTTARPLRNGYLFGAGRPLPFVAESGEVLPVWQQPTHFEDDLVLGGHEISLGVGTEEACALYDDLLDGARRRWHSVLAVNLHPANYAGYSGDWGRHLVAQTAARGVPIWDAERWLAFTEARAALRVRRPRPARGGGTGWRLDVPRAVDDADLLLLVPQHFAGAGLEAPADGPEIEHFGWRYRGLPLRGAPAVIEARYAVTT